MSLRNSTYMVYIGHAYKTRQILHPSGPQNMSNLVRRAVLLLAGAIPGNSRKILCCMCQFLTSRAFSCASRQMLVLSEAIFMCHMVDDAFISYGLLCFLLLRSAIFGAARSETSASRSNSSPPRIVQVLRVSLGTTVLAF